MDRLPPGQILTKKFPVLHVGDIPEFDETKWDFKIFGLVESELILSYGEFMNLPSTTVMADFHCVTTWSRYDNLWEGISSRTIADIVNIKSGVKFVMIHSEGGYTTNLPIKEFLDDDVLFAFKHDGKPIAAEHGFPLRLVVPKLYAWKSAKWVRAVEFMKEDKRGFWESRGYHNHGNPWTEERFSSQEKP